ncbi:MAG: hypothetical protein Alpg2KO_24690 [Alphaproteobacteria bacterium]
MKRYKPPKPRSPVAKALRSPNLKQQVVRDKTRYTRKSKHKKRPDPILLIERDSVRPFCIAR